MDLYFAGSQSIEHKQFVDLGAHRLFSYHNEEKMITDFMDLNVASKSKLFIDSGAYSVLHSGAVVDIDKYIDFINKHHDKATLFAELDVIPPDDAMGDKVKTDLYQQLSYDNYKYIMERVKCPDKIVYILHFGEDVDKFIDIIETPINGHYPKYVGIPGRHGVRKQDQIDYFATLFARILASKNPTIQTHAFGITDFDILSKYPFTSADSTSWIQYGAYGMILTPAGIIRVSDRPAKNKATSKKDFAGADEEVKTMVKETCARYGINWAMLDNPEEGYKHRMLYNILYMHEVCNSFKHIEPAKVKKRLL